VDYIENLIQHYDDTPAPPGAGSLLTGADPALPERWQGERRSLTMPRDHRAMVEAWKEGERLVARHPVMSLQHAARDARRLEADLRTTGDLDAAPPLEWRRVLDCCYICGIRGWSNVRRNALGDGDRRPLIKRGLRYKLASDGTVLY